jgi:hypothetical protein
MAGNKSAGAASWGGAYGLGFIGAIVYYMASATGFWDVIWGIFQSLVWPAFFVYEVLDFIKA